MAQPFKLRYVNQISGIFVLTILITVIAGVIVMGKSQGWFRATTSVTVDLPEEGSFGLRPGADVIVLGSVVGNVRAIRVEDERMFADLRIRTDFMRFIRSDSTASIRRTLGIGDAFIEISRGRSAALLPPDAHLPAETNVPPTEMMEQTIEQIRAEVVPAIQELRTGVNEYTKVAAELRNPEGSLQEALANLQRITGSIADGKGVAGRLIMDPELATRAAEFGPRITRLLDDAEKIMADLRATSASLPPIAQSTDEQLKRMPELLTGVQQTLERAQVILEHVEDSTAELPALVRSINQTSVALPGLVLQTQESFRQFQRLVEAVQDNWLVRPFVSPGEESGSGRISAEGRSSGRTTR